MGTEAKATSDKKRRGPRKRVEAVFITKTEIGQHMGVGDLGTIDTWVAKGDFPPPHSQPGQRFAVWLRRHWNAYVETGAWPLEAFPFREGPA